MSREEKERSRLRELLRALCRDISQILALVNERLPLSPSFVHSAEYKDMKNELRRKSEELRRLKALTHNFQHCYSLILTGDLLRNGRLIRDQPVNYEFISAIDCKLGDDTQLNNTVGSHLALRNVISSRLGSMFHNRKFNMQYIVQLR